MGPERLSIVVNGASMCYHDNTFSGRLMEVRHGKREEADQKNSTGTG
jgi:hypothetical protein